MHGKRSASGNLHNTVLQVGWLFRIAHFQVICRVGPLRNYEQIAPPQEPGNNGFDSRCLAASAADIDRSLSSLLSTYLPLRRLCVLAAKSTR
jgi:hypothetical protein